MSTDTIKGTVTLTLDTADAISLEYDLYVAEKMYREASERWESLDDIERSVRHGNRALRLARVREALETAIAFRSDPVRTSIDSAFGAGEAVEASRG